MAEHLLLLISVLLRAVRYTDYKSAAGSYLGVGYIEKKPAVVETPEGDTIAIRHKMYLSLSYDHRVVDGIAGGNFLHFIADYLENWEG